MDLTGELSFGPPYETNTGVSGEGAQFIRTADVEPFLRKREAGPGTSRLVPGGGVEPPRY